MTPKLAQGLAALRRRLLALGLAAGAGWGIVAAVAVLVGWMWLDLVLDFTGPVRAAASWLSLLCGLALLAWAAVITLGQGTARALAKRLDAVANTRGQILAGVDLAGQQQSGAVSSGLAAIALGDGSSAAGEDALPMFGEGQNKWRATVAGVTAPTKYFVRGPGSRSRKFNVELITVPKLEGVRVRITPPAYTNRPPYEGAVPQGGFSGLAGTKIEIFAKSNRPLSGGSIEMDGGATIAMV